MNRFIDLQVNRKIKSSRGLNSKAQSKYECARSVSRKTLKKKNKEKNITIFHSRSVHRIVRGLNL